MQISMFDGDKPFKIDKPLRLITLFSGYDSQALALKYIGVPFEHYRTCEWAIPSIQALKDLHFENDDTDYSVGWNGKRQNINADEAYEICRQIVKEIDGEGKDDTARDSSKTTI